MRILTRPTRPTLIVLAMLALATPAAAADPASDKAAAADVHKANALMTAKKFRAAAELFESAHRRVPDPKTLFRAATAWQKSNEPVRAANDYARYLREAPEKAPSRAKAKKELDALGAQLAQLTIKADGASGVTLDGSQLDLPLPPVVYATTGAHQLEARFGDKTATQSVTAAANVVISVVLAAPADAAPATAPSPDATVDAPAPKKAPAEKRKPLPPLVVYVGAGVAVLAGGLTVLSGIDTKSQRDTFDSDRSQENLDAGKSKQTRTNILLGVTGGVIVLTGLAAVFLVDWKGKSGESVKVGAGPGSLVLGGTF